MTRHPLFDDHITLIRQSQSTPEESARQLYSHLTDSEKLGLLDGDIDFGKFLVDIAKHGYNFKPYCAGHVHRLGIPGIKFSDGPRGTVLGKGTTTFPVSSTRAATFNVDLEKDIGRAMGKEMRIFGGNLFGGICVNLARHPGWGRSQESYGEDPLLLGAFGTALTLGARENGMVCVKHYALNSMEDARFNVDVQVEEGTMHECYLPHFKRCLEEGGAESLMSSYNLVNGEYMGQNKEMLDGVVRETWGKEETFIVSDFVFGLRDGIKSVQAGLDVEYPTRSMRHMKVKKALHHKKIDWTSIERSGIRLIAAQLRFYSRLQSPEPGIEEAGCEAHRELSRQAATEGMILLKNVTTPAFPNEPILPLSATKCHRLIIIGELADSRQTGDFGSSAIKRDPEMITPLAGLRARKNTHIVYSDGKVLPSALELARSADAVFCMLGYTGLEEGECLTPADPKIMGHCIPGLYGFGARYFGGIGKLVVSGGGDRRSLSLPEKQEKLLKALSEAVGDRLILGIESGGPVLIPSTIREKCAAILLTGYGGCRFGTALRQVLFNENNAEPSGRLPFTIAENTKDYPELDFDSKKVIYDRYWGYRFLAKHDRKPAYPFGFGLGYGKIELVDLKCDKELDARFFSVKVTVRNVGQLLTSAVVQVYGRKLSGRTQEDYDQVLLGFNKTPVKLGEELVIQTDCRWDSLARWDIEPRSLSYRERLTNYMRAHTWGMRDPSDMKWRLRKRSSGRSDGNE